ncbi:MAG: DUF3570 domain-containing protein, partial [Sphingobacteriales bacterium]
INTNLQLAFVADLTSQSGFLSLPFYRVYFNDGTVHQEKLPDTRTKLPLGLRANYFLGDNVIIRTYYRYYTDNWGLKSHTVNLEVPVKINPFVSLLFNNFRRYEFPGSHDRKDFYEQFKISSHGRADKLF